MLADSGFDAERGQASPEWLGLVLLLVLLVTGALTGLGPLAAGSSLARTVGAKLICAVDLSDSCSRDPELVAAYGAELAEVLRDHAPTILYERGMRALPVDFATCRLASCSDAAPNGIVWHSGRGEPATAFVHVVDCRSRDPVHFAALGPIDCSGARAGDIYLQYWLYYPESATLRGVPVIGAEGYHRDDWESYQVRIGSDGEAEARASSHNGFNYDQGAEDWGSDAGIGPLRAAAEAVGVRNRDGWGPETGWLFVSGGSHAGNVTAYAPNYSRLTPPGHLSLIPLDEVDAGGRRTANFAISPPWRKHVWGDPEAAGTD